MSFLLLPDDLALALKLIDHPDAARLCASLQSVCVEMGAALAASLGVTTCPAVSDDGSGPRVGVAFAPAETGQECPQLLWAFGDLAEWGN